jgi:hypothetical protein
MVNSNGEAGGYDSGVVRDSGSDDSSGYFIFIIVVVFKNVIYVRCVD